jgi:outer membrane protein OmpA-like peptidoglycan-associated protein
MNQNPTMKIDIRSHTDSRQTLKYKKVSDKEHSLQGNISRKWYRYQSRVTAKGYGETQLIKQLRR